MEVQVWLKFFEIPQKSFKFVILVGLYFLITFKILSNIHEIESNGRACSQADYEQDNLLRILRVYRSLNSKEISVQMGRPMGWELPAPTTMSCLT
jgi:hypothetical protein